MTEALRTTLEPFARAACASLCAIPAFAVLLGFGAVAPDVLTVGNLWNIATQTSYLAIFTLGQTIVLLTAGSDLSIGMTVSYTSVLAALALVSVATPGLAVLAYLAAGLGAGLVIGGVNGFLVSIIGVNPFIVTLGTYNILLALSSTVTGGFPVSGFPPIAGEILADASDPRRANPDRDLALPFSLSSALFCGAPCSAAASTLLARTRTWRWPPAFGSGCIRLAPISFARDWEPSAACLLSARAGSGEPNIGGSLALQTVAAAVIGGARLRGGKGGVLSALLGAFFITVLSNGMNLARIDGYIQQLCIGAIIILSLLVEQLSQNAERSS